MEQKKPTARPASKPTAKRAGKPPKKPEGTAAYVMGWLGRQVGHVKNAVKTDVPPAGKKRVSAATKPAATKPQPAASARPSVAAGKPPAENSPAENAPAGAKVIYREDKIEEAEMPDRPGVILRRTIIDEVVVKRKDVVKE